MCTDHAIRFRNVGKCYRVGAARGGGKYQYQSLGERLSGFAKHPLRSLGGGGAVADDEFWALRDVSFDVPRGEVVGVIGRNGAGKSTLLKVLSQITKPTEGEIEVHGRVGSLLEVGTGFHPELTGRENVFLNGAILGMTRREVKSKFDEIVAFSEVERFLDTPVKQYSSGMYTRLAFAVAAHLDPEILVVDEVLAVGDAGFQKKCVAKMKTVAETGRTVLLVSHNMAVLDRLCTQAVLLNAGTVEMQGSAGGVIASYQSKDDEVAFRGYSGTIKDISAISVGNTSDHVKPLDPLCVRIRYEHSEPLKSPHFGICFVDSDGVRSLWLRTDNEGSGMDALPASGTVECSIPSLPLATGVYRLVVGCGDSDVQLDICESDVHVKVAPDEMWRDRIPASPSSRAYCKASWDTPG